jgi:hypothetical protein
MHSRGVETTGCVLLSKFVPLPQQTTRYEYSSDIKSFAARKEKNSSMNKKIPHTLWDF